MNVGDLYWVELPMRGGHAQTGRRPAIVVQKTSSLSTVLLVPLTSQLDTKRFPGTVLITKTPENGLRQDSVALVFQLAATDKRYLMGALGVLADSVMEQIWQSLDEITGRI
ncbi:MAG: type II toxin-antitoxin system PemK/MazF family toxin [Acidobacteria bacterium]|nr:type II toxin-antitoxin system PemK/MazF family toxin [Acidobacteriota bacterium]